MPKEYLLTGFSYLAYCLFAGSILEIELPL
jgi:hypothetical protein